MRTKTCIAKLAWYLWQSSFWRERISAAVWAAVGHSDSFDGFGVDHDVGRVAVATMAAQRRVAGSIVYPKLRDGVLGVALAHDRARVVQGGRVAQGRHQACAVCKCRPRQQDDQHGRAKRG